MTPPKIGITLGDPGGIGPEVTLRALSLKDSLPKAHYIIFGSSSILEEEKKRLRIKLEIQPLQKEKTSEFPSFSLKEIPNPLKIIEKGSPSSENGRTSFLFFEEAIKEAQKRSIQALVTSPISKRSWALAGIPWSGHTDYLHHIYPEAIMAFWSERLKVALYTHHLPLRKALEKIKQDLLIDFFLLLDQNLKKSQSEKFHFLVAGLNPHAGEEGLLGTEEKEEIVPAIERAQKQGVSISGPFPPDIVFRQALNQPDKIVIALYHDQGLIPFKLESFDEGVNLTLGLPFARTSPDHGTAFDIAGKGEANPQSMIKAIRLVYKLSPPL